MSTRLTRRLTRRSTRTLAAATVTALVGGIGLTAAPAQAAPGERSLATVLAADGNRFDRTWNDFDILDRAVRTVLKAKPGSDVAVLADGSTDLTAFLPTDRAFRKLVYSVRGFRPHTEARTFRAVANTFDVDTIETVLLYHVVPGPKITYREARKADGVALDTAAGAPVTVSLRDGRVFLRDADTDNANPRIREHQVNLNKGNRQLAHGINRVLRPVDLP